ncbi:hypothetical protein J2752_002146 [Halarchaeum rubridurum]|uniref:DUF7312 domain-containing protein n=1 Tax=Halarchaeum rubridurum TaxID=489911 RepID=A0A830FWG6_9EURY|nr:hypothetical protein [Halarchaeum rubridurum]MBP1955234.1 hypothetical protein [Halarchaeum rubridurum]GGM67925.1 hypothetical protein GCM10009017_17620 [Halarchaeum rubridurum]
MAGTGGDDATDDGEWRFGVDEVGEDGAVAQEPESPPVEPGSPSAENVAFFVVGVALAVGTFALLLL